MMRMLLAACLTASVCVAAESPLPKVLIVGDSISLGYTPIVREKLKGVAEVSRPPCNCGPSQNVLAHMKDRDWAGGGRWDVIHVNFGIWDNHYLTGSSAACDGARLYRGGETNASPIAAGTAIRDKGYRIRTPIKDYERNLRAILAYLRTRADRVVFALSTPLTGWKDDDRCGRIRVYNELAADVCRELGVDVDDLHSVAERHLDQQTDGCHFSAAGYAILADAVADSVRTALEGGTAPRRLLTLTTGRGNARNGEGDLVRLGDGSILFVYGEWTDDLQLDGAQAHIVARRTSDGGRTWTPAREVFPREGAMNDMSVSLLRLADGRLALFNCRKNSDEDCMPVVRFSSDEAKTWSAPVECMPAAERDYYVLNNARVIQLASGRLVAPLAKHSPKDKEGSFRGMVSCVLSDDGGRTWRKGREYPVRRADGKRITVQEPGVVELKDGRVYMVMRTCEGRQWQAFSSDGGETWTDFGPSPLYGPLAPATLKRAPDGRLLAVWNDHEGHPEYGARGGWGRVPLTIAFSSDEGRTWKDKRVIEPDLEGFNCYIATLFDGEDLLLHYYCTQPGLTDSCVTRVPGVFPGAPAPATVAAAISSADAAENPPALTSRAVAEGEYLVFGQLRPEYQQEIVKHAGLQVIHADGAVTLRLKDAGRTETQEGAAKHTVIRFADEARPFRVTRHIRTWDDCDVAETWIEVVHDEKGPARLVRADSFATALKVKADPVKVLSLTGVWGHEGNVSESPVGKGQIVELASKSGVRDAWESNAAMMVSFGDKVDEERGQVLGVALEWTGTTCRRVRRAWDGSFSEVFAGVDMTTGPYVLDPGKVFTTPKAILVWSEKGRGEVSRQLHRWARNHCLPHGRELHPILLNSWEGSYFSFTEKTLTDMMDGVKEMGGEMFVLDDGWFGRGKYARDDKNRDRVGLGDWYVNPEKLPHGLGWLADEAGRRGLKFGLWVEPEMCNTTSWLAEEHPEWILREEGRPLVLGRGWTQVVLDMTNPAVRERLFTMLDKVYSDIPTLAYIKWDANQNISNPGSTCLAADRQPNLWYDYTVGLYDLLARFRAKRPQIMVQACASGGGHMDYGFLRYADEFWTSDNTDPLARVFMQWGALQFYPACAMACHVTASPNHMTKRVTPLKYRFDVAMCGRMGFELHPKDLKPEEIAFAKAAVADYKQIRPIVQQGDLYRLASPYGNTYAALQYVDEPETSAVVFVLGLDAKDTRMAKVVLRGLDPARTYVVTEIDRGARPHGTFDAIGRTGDDLMSKGVEVVLDGEFDSAVLSVSAKAAVR